MRDLNLVWRAAVLSLLIMEVSSLCAVNNKHHCKYTVQCLKKVQDVALDIECQANTRVQIELNLINAEQEWNVDYYDNALVSFLEHVTTFTLTEGASFNLTSLLLTMNRLKHLNLAGNNIDHIYGAPFLYLYNLESVDLSHNSLSEIDDIFELNDYSSRLKVLLLAHNKIEELDGDAFASLTSLTELDLSYNFISDLREEPFMNLTSLEILKLNGNKIKDLNGALNNLFRLKKLYLRGNEIENINDQSLKIIKDLEVFDISNNNLNQLTSSMLSRHWGHFGQICKIDLSNNEITNIPDSVSIDDYELHQRLPVNKHRTQRYTKDVDMSIELDLSGNQVNSIKYNAFHSILRLTNLDLSRNQLQVFNINPRDLEFLMYLNLSQNFISKLHFTSFSFMRNLQNLDLSYNRLDNLPENTFNNINYLRKVNMTHNFLKSIEILRIKMFHPEGGVLDLSHNDLYKLNIPYGRGSKLTDLILRSNNVNDPRLIYLVDQDGLIRLDLSYNKINDLNATSLALPQYLEFLDLSDNNIATIDPGTFSQLNHLTNLKIQNNSLSEFEFGTFQGLSALKYLDLSFNQLNHIDSEAMMDMKSLEVLSLRNNHIGYLDYKVWLNHEPVLKVYLDDNNYSCSWLAKAIHDFDSGYSKMEVITLNPSNGEPSVGSIACKPNEHVTHEKIVNAPEMVFTEDKLLVMFSKLLKAINEQTEYLKTMNYQTKYSPAIKKLLDGNSVYQSD